MNSERTVVPRPSGRAPDNRAFLVRSMLLAWILAGAAASPRLLAREIFLVPCDTGCIQEAIDDAGDGDVVVLAPGTYREHSIRFHGKKVRLTSRDPASSEVVEQTVVDGGGGGNVFLFVDGEGNDSVLSGLTIRGGSAADDPPRAYVNGGGVFCLRSAPTIEHCVIEDNHARDGAGGGISCNPVAEAMVIRSTTIRNNTAARCGGGALLHGPTVIEDSIIEGNELTPGETRRCDRVAAETGPPAGGGLFAAAVAEGAVTIRTSTIRGNRAPGGAGGGVYFWNSVGKDVKVQRTSIVERSLIEGNTAQAGAGGACGADPATQVTRVALANTVFLGNEAGERGGGFLAEETCDFRLAHTTLAGNAAGVGGGALSCKSQPERSTVALSLLAENRPDEISPECRATVEHSDVFLGDSSPPWPGTGNLNVDPDFGASGWRPNRGSPVLDQEIADPPSQVDFDADPRPLGDGVDMGADEVFPRLEITGIVPAEPLSTTGGTQVIVSGSGFAVSNIFLVEGEMRFELAIQSQTSRQIVFDSIAYPAGPQCGQRQVALEVVNANGETASAALAYRPAEVLHVPASDTPGYLEGVVARAPAGACLLLAENEVPGYVANLTFGSRALTVYGADPERPERTIISGRVPDLPVITFEPDPGHGTLLGGVALTLGFGGISIQDASPRLQDLLIQNNSRRGAAIDPELLNGGGIAVRGASAPTLERLIVTYNEAAAGGGFYAGAGAAPRFLSAVLVADNVALAAEGGGGLWLADGTDLVLNDVEIRSNEAEAGPGGGIRAGAGASLVLEGASTVTGNRSQGTGGGIHADAGSRLEIRGESMVTDNTAGPRPNQLADGGGVYAGMESTVIVTQQSAVERNRAREGGGLWLGDHGRLTLREGSGISENSALGNSGGPARGSGIFLGRRAQIQLEGAAVSANVGGRNPLALGGGMYAGEFLSGTIEATAFEGNVAQSGGAVYLERKAAVKLSENRVLDNRSRQSGSANEPSLGPGIYARDSVIQVTGNLFRGNRPEGATEETGGLHLDQPYLFPRVTGNTFENNTHYGVVCSTPGLVRDIDDNVFRDNAQGPHLNCASEPPER